MDAEHDESGGSPAESGTGTGSGADGQAEPLTKVRVNSLVHDYLKFYGYSKTLQCFEAEQKAETLRLGELAGEDSTFDVWQHKLLDAFDTCDQVLFVQLWDGRLPSRATLSLSVQRTYFFCRVYFATAKLRSGASRQDAGVTSDMHTLQAYLGEDDELASDPECSPFFTLPIVKQIQQHPVLSVVYQSQWAASIRQQLGESLAELKENNAPELVQLLQAVQSRFSEHERFARAMNERDASFRDICRQLFIMSVRLTQDLFVLANEDKDGDGKKDAEGRISEAYVNQFRSRLSRLNQRSVDLCSNVPRLGKTSAKLMEFNPPRAASSSPVHTSPDAHPATQEQSWSQVFAPAPAPPQAPAPVSVEAARNTPSPTKQAATPSGELPASIRSTPSPTKQVTSPLPVT